MTKLSLSVQWHDDETLLSFCSRLGAANGSHNVKDFCWYLDLDHRKLVSGDPAEVGKLLKLADVDDVRGRLLVKDGSFYDVNGQRLAHHSVMQSRLRFCPHCLREDRESRNGRLEARGYLRLTWCITYLRTCPKHGSLLQVAEHSELTGTHDVARMIAAEARQFPVPQGEVHYRTTEFEQFIASALRGRRESHGWIDEFPLYVVGRMSEWIGCILLFGKTYLVEDLSDADLWLASQAGFVVMKGGRAKFEDTLKLMHVDFWQKKTHTGGRALYGRLYERLAYETDDPAYEPIRKVMYDVTLDSLPMGPGDELFGRVTERRIHSVHSAAQEYGIHPKTLRKLLSSAKRVLGADVLSDERVLLPKDEMLALVDRMRGNLTSRDATEYLGVSRTLWTVLVNHQFIKSASGGPTQGMYDLYKTTDLDTFFSKVSSFATLPFDASSKLAPVGLTIKRASCKYSEVLNLLFEGKLHTVSIDPSRSRMKSVFFDPDEVKELTKLADHGSLSVVGASKELAIRSDVMRNLMDAKWVEEKVETNPINRSKQRVIERSAVEKFKTEYISLFHLAEDFRMNIGIVRRDLEVMGITPTIFREQVGATFYRRSEFFCTIP
ncbi:TniQ family protein [Rhizobium leguminosarum]|uniref:TniQ family protein n=1 Tax=Rhizobium leguminosarum TaxID=384 RepID=UPI001F1A6B78|nr:TniQ family protein [Rhizobium leguminosarum]UIK19356.1 TniQ family protein [Rhizobium leguminosarum]